MRHSNKKKELFTRWYNGSESIVTLANEISVAPESLSKTFSRMLKAKQESKPDIYVTSKLIVQ